MARFVRFCRVYLLAGKHLSAPEGRRGFSGRWRTTIGAVWDTYVPQPTGSSSPCAAGRTRWGGRRGARLSVPCGTHVSQGAQSVGCAGAGGLAEFWLWFRVVSVPQALPETPQRQPALAGAPLDRLPLAS